MPPETRSHEPGIGDQATRRGLLFETATRNRDGEPDAALPVDTLASFDMSDDLRAMIVTAQSPDVLPRLYADLRERLDRVSAIDPDRESVNTQIPIFLSQVHETQELTNLAHRETQDLSEIVRNLTKDTRAVILSTQDEIRLLREQLQELQVKIPDSDTTNSEINSLSSRLRETQEQAVRARSEISELPELTVSLNTENTLLPNRLRALEDSRPLPQSNTPPRQVRDNRDQVNHEHVTRQVSTARSPIIESASHFDPRRDIPAIMPREREPMPTTTGPVLPTYEEFMAGRREPVYQSVLRTNVPVTNLLNPVSGTPPIVTPCAAPTQVFPPNLDASTPVHDHDRLLHCPGLRPHVPMLTPFKIVVSYYHYRLQDTRAELSAHESDVLYRVKRRFDALYPTFERFDGTVPIKLLEFFSTLREGFDALRVSEVVAALVLAYYLDGSAKTHYTSQTAPGVRTKTVRYSSTWPYLVDSMIKRYLTDDVLQHAYEKVTDAKQKQDEDENKFADRVISAARDCCNVFEDSELVNYFVRGLLPSTRDSMSERVRRFSLQEQSNITVARQIAQAEGNTFRARRAASSPSGYKTSRSRGNTMLVTEHDNELTPTPSPPRHDPQLPHLVAGSNAYWADLRLEDPKQASRIARNLESLLFVGNKTGPTNTLPPTSPANSTSLDGLVSRAHVEVPKLSEAQYRDAITVIPPDYWNLNCWTCKTDGHTTFTCPSLTPEQRMYFAYCYFLYQCKGQPAMRDWLHQRYAKRVSTEEDREKDRRDNRDNHESRTPRSTKYIGSGAHHGKPYQNRKDRDSNKSVKFAKSSGVYITTQVLDTPPVPSWQDTSHENSSDSENEKGRE